MKKKILLFISVIAWMPSIAQQAMHISQYIFTPMSLNPAYAGYRDQWYANALYRKQWVGFEGAPQNISITADGYVNDKKSLALGVQINTDRIGSYQSNLMMATVASTIYFDDKLKNKGLSLGIGLGARDNKLLTDQLVFNDIDDPNIVLSSDNWGLKADARAGVYFFLPRFYAGLSVLNILGDYQAQDINANPIFKNGTHMYLNIGAYFPFSESLGLKPFMVYKDDFHGISNFDFSAFLDFNQKVWVGASYQMGLNIWDAKGINTNAYQSEMISGVIEWFVQNRTRIGCSYDIMVNGLQSYQQGSHEISLGFYIQNPNKYNRLIGPRLF